MPKSTALIISDPTTLITGGDAGVDFAAPIVLNASAKTITITPGSGTLSDTQDGVTGQALYSALKIIWKNSSTYIKYPFPMEAITPEQFDFINGWTLANDTTRKALRTCGWAEKNSGGTVTRKYMGVVSLGTVGDTDYSYFQWNSDAKADFQFPGPINESIQIYGDVSNGSFDYTDGGDTLKLFNRIQSKLYSSSNNTAIGASTLTYITYRFPLSNATDLKITATDSHIASAPTVSAATWASNEITFTTSGAHGLLVGSRVRVTGGNPAAYNGVYTVASSADSTHFKVAKTSDPGTWVATTLTSIHAAVTIDYLAGTETHDVNEDASNETYKYIITDASGVATTQEIYEKMQYQLRQNTDISSGATTVTGTTASSIAAFVGDTLVGEPGVYISGLNSNYKNSITFYSYSDTTKATPINYPFIAGGYINFGAQAGTGDFKYWMFYSTLTGAGNDYGESGATLVKDSTGADITGTYSGSSITWDFKYDSETASGGRTIKTDTPVKVIGIGLNGGQFISVDHTITKTVGQNILVAPATERNYSNA